MTLRTVHTKTEKTNSIYPSNPKPFPPPIKITTIFYMILSASRRTDIPAFFSDWFYKRIEEGFFMVRNPMNVHRVSKISVSPQNVECFVFWTKNPSDDFITTLKKAGQSRLQVLFSVHNYILCTGYRKKRSA